LEIKILMTFRLLTYLLTTTKYLTMRLPNLNNIFAEAKTTLLRFPIVMLIAAIGVNAAIQLLRNTDIETSDFWKTSFIKQLWLSGIGVSLSFAFAMMAERKILKIPSVVAQSIALVLLGIYLFILPADFKYFNHFWLIQLALFFLASHLFVAFAPFSKSLNINGFWQYNKSLFLNILTSLLYTYVLFAGLALSLASVHFLFNMEINWRSYWYLFCIMQGIFNTWFFLSKVPRDFDILNDLEEYPRGLKLFAQYVLLPLVCLYLLILYVYEAKILLAFSLPVGWVANLIIAFSVVGILCFLLLYPFGKKEENAWISKFNKAFYYLLLPLLVLLFVAIGYRIQAYGFTENRYFVMLIGLWLLGISLYFIFSKRDNISVIPMSLAVVIVLSSIGFWGAYSVSMRSQESRLATLFERNAIDPKNVPEDRTLLRKDAVEINNILTYFSSRNELFRLYPMFQVAANEKFDTLGTYEQKNALLKKVKVPNVNYYYGRNEEKTDTVKVSFSGNYTYDGEISDYYYNNGYNHDNAVKITGYDYLISNVEKPSNDTTTIYLDKDFSLKIYSQDSNRVYFVHGTDIQTIDLQYFLAQAKKYNPTLGSQFNDNIPADALSFEFDAPKYHAKLMFNQLSASYRKDKNYFINDFSFKLLVRKR
jgi:hypothetical protein